MLKSVILCGPSGSGKTTLSKHILTAIHGMRFSISACSRPPRKGETNGVDYHFIDRSTFEQKIESGAFLEYEEVYPGSFYGTLKSEFENAAPDCKALLFDIDVKGGINLKSKLTDSALSVFIAPPSVAVLRQRLKDRNTENPASIAKRIAKMEYELSFQPQFDYVLINDDLSTAEIELAERVKTFLR